MTTSILKYFAIGFVVSFLAVVFLASCFGSQFHEKKGSNVFDAVLKNEWLIEWTASGPAANVLLVPPSDGSQYSVTVLDINKDWGAAYIGFSLADAYGATTRIYAVVPIKELKQHTNATL